MRLTFVVSSLSCGGIERVTVRLCEGLAARGHEVTLLTFADESWDFFRVPQNVSRVALGIGHNPRTPLWRLAPATARRLARIRQAVQSSTPDVVISRAVHVNVPTLMALRGLGYPAIVTEHGDRPVRHAAASAGSWRKWLWYRLRRFFYPSAFTVVSVCQAVDRHFSWLSTQRRAVIHNPFPAIKAVAPGVAQDRPRLVTMGRLSHDKGFDVLLRAFARIAGQFRQWQLVILGDGELRHELRRLSDELALGDQVVFAGAVSEPLATLQQAQLFVMASRYEGFPNALGEALSCGLPVIATDCPSRPRRAGRLTPAREQGGVRELVRDGVDGWLVPPDDPAALAHALAGLMADPGKRRRMAERAREVTERFAFDRILDDWERLLHRAAASNDSSGRSCGEFKEPAGRRGSTVLAGSRAPA